MQKFLGELIRVVIVMIAVRLEQSKNALRIMQCGFRCVFGKSARFRGSALFESEIHSKIIRNVSLFGEIPCCSNDA